jgi:hypothetical protein
VVDELSPGAVLNYVERAHVIHYLDEIRHRAEFRPFSRGGDFLRIHSLEKMLTDIGGPEDNSSNRFTARILLLLNSRPLVNEPAYNAAIESMLDKYWKPGLESHEPHRPVYLLNDIRRWWNELLLNFELHSPPPGPSDATEEQKAHRLADRRIANLKLRYARLLAAHTPILSLLHKEELGGVTRDQVREVMRDPPITRLYRIYDGCNKHQTKDRLEQIIRMYDDYLLFMNEHKDELRAKVLRDDWHQRKTTAYEFGDLVAGVLQQLGAGGHFLRNIII